VFFTAIQAPVGLFDHRLHVNGIRSDWLVASQASRKKRRRLPRNVIRPFSGRDRVSSIARSGIQAWEENAWRF
jgi:hypothetical protein